MQACSMLSVIEEFVSWVRRRNPVARTWRYYGYDLHAFVEAIMDRPSGDITLRDVDRFVNLLVERGLQPGTANRRLDATISTHPPSTRLGAGAFVMNARSRGRQSYPQGSTAPG